ncbi:5-carboxymethyl-2-hydroxymuconate Delta-isomerase [Shewanella mesophila]|uniref:5-carboxymethyl-2-hydroxymuconate Delta-isomerase n=1 Tax=Shewanella mesophila TaxID=2864208 RepID=UPI0021ABF8E1|nr:5-carboxymethyl-2-hydroxymuconate Delta-isomerase [Shewanella mesophila]
MAMSLLFGHYNMPHCIIEYSAPLAAQIDINELLQSVHQGALASELFEPSAVKTRGYASQNSQVGLLADGSFIHIIFKIMPGRTDGQKKHLTEVVYQQISNLTLGISSLTMEVLELESAHYFKLLS